MPFGVMLEKLDKQIEQMEELLFNIRGGDEGSAPEYYPQSPGSGVVLTSGPTNVKGAWANMIPSGTAGYNYRIQHMIIQSPTTGITMLFEIGEGDEREGEIMGMVREYDRPNVSFDSPHPPPRKHDASKNLRMRFAAGASGLTSQVWTQYVKAP